MSESPRVPERDEIPEELADRDQWLMFDTSSDSPRRPHWRGNFRVSWNDPDDWHSFEEAREAALERDSWGIGYVFSNTNDKHARGLYGALDLDGVEGDGGHPKDWLPSLAPFADAGAYIEWSPSGNGLHIPLAGFEPPEWWSDSHFTDEEHEGVEAYGSKFFTFTGDKLRNSGDTVADAGEWVDEWLKQVYRALNGEDAEGDEHTVSTGEGDDRETHTREEFLGREEIEDALDHIDPDVSYPLWRDVGFALADFFGSHTAKSLFTSWSRRGSKWDSEAERQADRIIDGASSGGRTIGTVIYHARKGGWTMPTPSSTSDTPDTPDTDEACADGGAATIALAPREVCAIAGLGEDEGVPDLDDRQKAACVWDLINQSDEYHIRVRRDNGSLWSFDDDRGVWTNEGERALRHAARKALGSMNYGSNVLAEVKAQARSDPFTETEGDEFGLDPGVVAVKNGLLDLEAAANGAGMDAIRPLRPDDLALTRLPVAYDPTAEVGEWAEYVAEWAEDGKADALQEYVGYCLEVGDLPIHRALLLVGSGANGKGTFLSVVRSLLGTDNTTSIELQTLANEKDAVADFYGSVANIDDDLSSRSLGKGLGMFKKLVAGDYVRARRLYEDGFQYRPTGKHLYAANEVPEVEVPEGDDAFWRRWLLVEFPNHYAPSERDPQLDDRLTEDDTLSGVLNWAIEGRRRLLEQGRFTNEAEYGQQKRQRWQSWGESVDKFIAECTRQDPDADRITTGDAHRRYAAWCRENDEDAIGQQEFTRKMKSEEFGYKRGIRINGKVERGYNALAFTEDVPALDETPDRGSNEQHRQRRDGDLSGY